DPQGAGDRVRHRSHVQGRACVDDEEGVIGALETTLDLRGRDPRDPEAPEKALALDELDRDGAHEHRAEDQAKPVAETGGAPRHRASPYHRRSGGRDAATAATNATASVIRPAPASAPTPSRTGTAGTGRPICSASTNTKSRT